MYDIIWLAKLGHMTVKTLGYSLLLMKDTSTYGLVMLQEGEPLPGPETGLLLTLRNELSEETHADKARDFIGKGHPGGGQ